MTWHNYQSFSSSSIAAVSYDDEQNTLEVAFLNGGRYHYYDVPPHVSKDFEQAESKGEFLARNIKGQYRYSRV